ncbi:MAG TPA: hypothetical protein VIS96_13355 [Terrimicrobiaceae bacterium]
MNDPHETLLEQHFFELLDRGYAPEATALFTGIYNGESLSHLIARQFQLPQCEAEAAIEIARREVAL